MGRVFRGSWTISTVRMSFDGTYDMGVPFRQGRDGAWSIVRPGEHPETDDDDGGGQELHTGHLHHVVLVPSNVVVDHGADDHPLLYGS
jgi:hypothetical protein